MEAIETNAIIDHNGYLKMDKPLELKDKQVKLIILVNEDDEANEMIWLKNISSNPVFDFLKSEDENIYTLKDGKPFHD